MKIACVLFLGTLHSYAIGIDSPTIRKKPPYFDKSDKKKSIRECMLKNWREMHKRYRLSIDQKKQNKT